MTDHVNATPELLRGLVDDAGIFPPERLAMDVALARHEQDVVADSPVLTHRFLLATSRVDDFLRVRRGATHPIRVGLIAGPGATDLEVALDQIARDTNTTVDLVEAPPDQDESVPVAVALADLRIRLARHTGVPRFLEIPRRRGWLDALDEVRGDGVGAKLRCGGLIADMFPTSSEIAAFLHGCVARDLTFKCTAGLHHAVRHRAEVTGFDHHGFLNVVLAAALAVDGAAHDDIVHVLGETDAEALALRFRDVDDDLAARTRARFVSYGSCSTSEPIEDLVALGLLT